MFVEVYAKRMVLYLFVGMNVFYGMYFLMIKNIFIECGKHVSWYLQKIAKFDLYGFLIFEICVI